MRRPAHTGHLPSINRGKRQQKHFSLLSKRAAARARYVQVPAQNTIGRSRTILSVKTRRGSLRHSMDSASIKRICGRKNIQKKIASASHGGAFSSYSAQTKPRKGLCLQS